MSASAPLIGPIEAPPAPKEYVCPECAEQGIEKVFPRPQSLGSHRRLTHGHVSTNPKTLQSNERNAARRAGKPAAKAAPKSKPKAEVGVQVVPEFEPNKLLHLLFPHRIPVDAALLTRTGNWLTEASEIWAAANGK